MSSDKPPEASQTKTAPRQPPSSQSRARTVPGLLLAYAPPSVTAGDRAPVRGRLIVGRGSDAGFSIRDQLLSRKHFEVSHGRGQLVVADLGSHNGTTVDGAPVTEPRSLDDGAVLRAGSCLFSAVPDIGSLGEPGDAAPEGLAGRFHGPAIGRRLRVAARTGRHVLLEGESGVGKELAASYLHQLYRAGGHGGPMVAQNAALFAGEEDAVASLFGVVKGGFTGVEERAGAIEAAHGGTLFLDEIHNLPIRVQRTLLRFIENGLLQRVGGTTERAVEVRVVFGTNQPVETAVHAGALAHDLVARLHRVELPPLRQRRADVPDIFVELLRRVAPPQVASDVVALLDADLVEGLMRRDYGTGNVRELQDLAAFVVARIAEGEPPERVLADALGGEPPAVEGPPTTEDEAVPYGSVYELHRQEIVELFYDVDGNLTALERALRDRGVQCSRRWLATYLERWGVRRVKRRG